MERLSVSRLVTRFLLCHGHLLPAPWTAVEAEQLLRKLAEALHNPMVSETEPLSVSQYESALEELLDEGALQLAAMNVTGRLLEAFCSFLVDRSVLTINPHRPCQDRESVGAGPKPDNPSSAIQEPQVPQAAPPVATGWDWWPETEKAYFLAHQTGRNRFEGTTEANYRTDLKLASAFLTKHYAGVTADAIEGYVRYLEKVALNPRTNAPYERPTVVRKKNTLRGFLKFALPRVPGAPALNLDALLGSKSRDKTPVKPHRALSPDEDRAYLIAVEQLPLAERIMALLPRECATRAVDTSVIRWVDVDAGHFCLDYKCQKTGLRVQVPLSRRMDLLLQEYRRSCPMENFLFPNGEGAQTDDDVRKQVHKVAISAGITRVVTPHDLRVTFATHRY